MMVPKGLEQVVAHFALGLATTEELVQAAETAEQSGYRSEAFVDLLDPSNRSSDSAVLFEKGLNESKIPIPSEREAIVLLAKEIAKRILRGEVAYLEGAEAIRRLQLRTEDDIEALDAFRHASFEGNPKEANLELKQYYRDMVLEAARALVALDITIFRQR